MLNLKPRSQFASDQQRITIRLDPARFQRLNLISKERNWSQADILREGLDRFFSAYETEPKAKQQNFGFK